MRIEIRQDVLTRKYYNDRGMISHYRILLLETYKQPLDERSHALHGHNANHPGIMKMIQDARQKYCYQCIAKYIRTWVTKSQMCIQNERISKIFLNQNYSIVQNGIWAPKTFYKWIFFVTFRQAEDMTTSSQQLKCSHAIC